MRIKISHHTINISDQGPQDGPALVFAHSLGSDLSQWDALCAKLPDSLRLVRYDARGHGASGAPDTPYSMGQLIKDAEHVLDHLNVRDCVFLGAGMGGLIAQGLAVKRLDQIRALVLCGSAAKLGTPQTWARQIEMAQAQGMAQIAYNAMPLTFPRKTQDSTHARHWQSQCAQMDVQGYVGCCAAISGTDFYTPTAALRLPCLGLCGIDDRVTPPDLMRETVGLIAGSRFQLIRRAGHLPMLDAPTACAIHLNAFLGELGLPHLQPA
ncbi:3-oxoadipate enol-lactonase [Pacificibacter maritimus]|uniref:3-oxoadipate enol-lactonase n=1 Tax=Pacificibacter maritimus TaxID=762213 RepID=A0A3N4V0M3_9RHOB|nr:alpha/beta fold hydrolase [Pacificibacter maritimus]RPE67390.1 3-oxoadipate enol-lactonase [Pacificibacter maritimus]